MESTLSEDFVKTKSKRFCETMAKDLEYYINLVDKAAAGSERIDSNFEISSTEGKLLPNSIARYRETVHERKQSIKAANCTVVLF